MNELSKLNTKERSNLHSILRLQICHHSNAIEGISLTYGETIALLEKGITASNKPLVEQLIVSGYAKCYDLVVADALNKSIELNAPYIKDLHALMFEAALAYNPMAIERPIGAYRNVAREIAGVDVELASPLKISAELENLLYQPFPTNLDEIAKFHIAFERIHPFMDGNGRVGRLIMMFQCIRNDRVPPLIETEYRTKYLDAMNDAKKLAKFLEFSCSRSMDVVRTPLEGDLKADMVEVADSNKFKTMT